MGLFEGKTPAERNKTIAAVVLGLAALVLVLRMFFGGDSPAPRRPTANSNTTKAGTTPTSPNGQATADGEDPTLRMPDPLPAIIPASYSGSEAARNIFAFPPVRVAPTPALPVATEMPTPTPTPPPPLEVTAVSPSNVFARTGDFALDVSGDKFTPQTRVYVEGQELQTTFRGPQQLSAQVPAALVAGPGARSIMARTPDGALYSNTATINVMAPPVPAFTYIGLFGTPGYSRDRAVLKPNQSNQPNELLTVQRGDVVGGRFKVTNISDRAVEFEDTQLKIKHSVPYTEARGTNAPTGSGGRVRPQPPQPPDTDDDEP